MINKTDSANKKEKTLYEVLGLASNAKASFVDFTYNALLIDLNVDPEGNRDAIAELNAAYQILKDPNSRAWYDGELAKKAEQIESKVDPEPVLEKKLNTGVQNGVESIVQTKPKNQFGEFLKMVSLFSLFVWAGYMGYGYFFVNDAKNINASGIFPQSTTQKGVESKGSLKTPLDLVNDNRRIIVCTPNLTSNQLRDEQLINSKVLPALAAQDAVVDSEKKDASSKIYAVLKEGHLRITYQAYHVNSLIPVYDMFNNVSNLQCAENYTQHPARYTTSAGYETSYKAKNFLSLDKKTSDARRITIRAETARFAP